MSRNASCFNGRLFATRALALRSAETPRYWASLFEAAGNAWERRVIARVAFARHGHDFADPALDFLSREPEKYVQWELLSGSTGFRAGVAYRDYWDVWFSAPHSQYRLLHPDSWRNLRGKDLAVMLDWLEAGNRPGSDAVLDSLLSDLARGATGVGARRYLSYLSALETTRGGTGSSRSSPRLIKTRSDHRLGTGGRRLVRGRPRHPSGPRSRTRKPDNARLSPTYPVPSRFRRSRSSDL